MAAFKRGTRAWQLLTVAIIAVPWLLRDQLAASLETRTQSAQAILHALDNERQRQVVEREQRDTLGRLERIENLLNQVAKKITSAQGEEEERHAFDESVKAEGTALISAVDTFEDMLKDAAPGGSAEKAMHDTAQAAKTAAQGVEQQYGKGDEAQDAALLKTFDKASEDFEKAFEGLYDEAHRQSLSSARWADVSRFVAWVLTALGALMIGDWTRLTGGVRDDDEADGASGKA